MDGRRRSDNLASGEEGGPTDQRPNGTRPAVPAAMISKVHYDDLRQASSQGPSGPGQEFRFDCRYADRSAIGEFCGSPKSRFRWMRERPDFGAPRGGLLATGAY